MLLLLRLLVLLRSKTKHNSSFGSHSICSRTLVQYTPLLLSSIPRSYVSALNGELVEMLKLLLILVVTVVKLAVSDQSTCGTSQPFWYSARSLQGIYHFTKSRAPTPVHLEERFCRTRLLSPCCERWCTMANALRAVNFLEGLSYPHHPVLMQRFDFSVR